MTVEAVRAQRDSTSARVLAGVRAEGERLWRLSDFAGEPALAVAQAMSRLAARGELVRVRRGVYFRPRETRFGRSVPEPGLLLDAAADGSPLFPAGISAASRLGFTTQVPVRLHLSTPARRLRSGLVRSDARVVAGRPAAWRGLSELDGALLELLRDRGLTSELDPTQTIARTLRLLAEPRRLPRLLAAASTEPPRVRALLGALCEALGTSPRRLRPLRATLHPLSRFDFGAFQTLPSARAWQARGA